MYDNIKFRRQCNLLNFGKRKTITLFGAEFTRKRSKKTGQFYYEGKVKTLRFTIHETAIYISGSVSTFKYKHNANDLNLNEFCEVIYEICSILECTPYDLIPMFFEFALTIEVAIEVSRIIERIISYRRKEFKKEFRRGKLTSSKLFNTTYTAKAYDKAFVETLEGYPIKGNLLRIEMTYKKRHFKKDIVNLTANDLMNPEFIQKIFAEYTRVWTDIVKAPFIDHTKFKLRELHKFYAILNPLYVIDRAYADENEAVKKEVSRLKKTLQEVGDYSIFEKIEEDFTNKFKQLMASTNVQQFPAILLDEKRGQNGINRI